MAAVPRVEHVGSLLRPSTLLAAREELAAEGLTAAAFKQVEDDAVRDVIERQVGLGLPVLTDGEFRRESFQDQLTQAAEGFEGVDINAWLHGQWHSDEVGDLQIDHPGAAVVAPLRLRRSLAAEEFTFARAVTDRTVKVTLPSPSLMANLWDPQRSRDAYPTLDAFLADVVDVLQREVAELARLGCTSVQLDAPHYPLLVDPDWRAFYESRGWAADDWLAFGTELDNAVIDAAPGITFGFHLCRGNQASRWLVAGGYEPIAQTVFGRIHADRLLLEYDDERSGDFEPLRLVRDGTVAVLGLVTTKTGRVEDPAALSRRVEEATDHLPLERLAVGTQCGFATSVLGNDLSVDAQWGKLAALVTTAEHLWGAP